MKGSLSFSAATSQRDTVNSDVPLENSGAFPFRSSLLFAVLCINRVREFPSLRPQEEIYCRAGSLRNPIVAFDRSDASRASMVPFLFFAFGVLLVNPGCGGYTGGSQYAAVKGARDSFAGTIEAAGGSAEHKGQAAFGFQGSGWFIDLKGATITDDLLDAIIEAYEKDPVFQMDLSDSTITDAQLEKLDEGKVLQKLFELDLSGTSISDAGLDQLDHLHCITDLNLTGSQATAAGGKRLGERKIASPQTPKPLKTAPNITI